MSKDDSLINFNHMYLDQYSCMFTKLTPEVPRTNCRIITSLRLSMLVYHCLAECTAFNYSLDIVHLKYVMEAVNQNNI